MSGRTCSTHIDAPVQSVFQVLMDPASFTELMPGVQFVPEVITPDGVGTTYRFQTQVAGLPIRGSGRFTQVEANRHIRDETSIPIEGSFDYWFEAEDGGTRVTIEHPGPGHSPGHKPYPVTAGSTADPHTACLRPHPPRLKDHRSPGSASGHRDPAASRDQRSARTEVPPTA